MAPLQPGGYLLLDAGAWALEDWPEGNRVTAWVRLLRAGTAEGLAAALRKGLEEFPEPGDAGFRRVLRLWALVLLRANKAWSGKELAAIEDDQGEGRMTSLVEVNGRKIREGLIEQGRAEGMERGIARGLERGIRRGRSEERERLRRELSALKLDAEAAARVSELLDRSS